MAKLIETISMIITFYFLALGPLIGYILTAYLILCTRLWLITLAYLSFVFFFDRNTHETGGRPVNFIQNLPIWKHYANYLKVAVHFESPSKLNPKKNYLFCSHPHGMIPAGLFAGFLHLMQTSKQLTHQFLFASLNLHYLSPFAREVYLALGGIGSSAQSISHILQKSQGGHIVGLTPGGAEEALHAQPHKYRIVLKKRLGFVKLAIKTGTSLVPVVTFGENDLFKQSESPRVKRFVDKFRIRFGFAPIVPVGRGFLGLVPLKANVNLAVGDPIDVELNPEPSKEQVLAVHRVYCEALIRLFDKNKQKFGLGADQQLEFVA